MSVGGNVCAGAAEFPDKRRYRFARARLASVRWLSQPRSSIDSWEPDGGGREKRAGSVNTAEQPPHVNNDSDR